MKKMICCILIFIHHYALGQNINLVVKKGEVRLSNSILTIGEIVKLNPTARISLGSNAIALIRKNNKIIELKNNQTYEFEDLDKLFGAGKSFSSVASEVIFNQNFNNKSEAGVIVRGSSSIDVWAYQPADSLMIFEDSIKFKIGGPSSSLETDIRLYKKGSTDTLKIAKTYLQFIIKRPVAGVYYWEYTLRNGVYRNKFINYFIVPEPDTISSLKKETSAFRNEISKFSWELQQQLLKEYTMQKKVYIDNQD